MNSVSVDVIFNCINLLKSWFESRQEKSEAKKKKYAVYILALIEILKETLDRVNHNAWPAGACEALTTHVDNFHLVFDVEDEILSQVYEGLIKAKNIEQLFYEAKNDNFDSTPLEELIGEFEALVQLVVI